MISKDSCGHFPEEIKKERTDYCEECKQRFNIRVCLHCGHVGCCDSSLGHARKHYEESGHQTMAYFPVGDSSAYWCYEHDEYVDNA